MKKLFLSLMMVGSIALFGFGSKAMAAETFNTVEGEQTEAEMAIEDVEGITAESEISAKPLASSYTFSYPMVYWYSEAEAGVDKINELRSAAGLSSVKLDAKVTEAAMALAAEEMVYYGDTRPDGSDLFSVFSDYSVSSDNVPSLYRGVISTSYSMEEIVEALYEKYGSDTYFMDSSLKSVGLGRVTQPYIFNDFNVFIIAGCTTTYSTYSSKNVTSSVKKISVSSDNIGNMANFGVWPSDDYGELAGGEQMYYYIGHVNAGDTDYSAYFDPSIVSYSTSSSKKASIDSDGIVTGNRAGTATVTGKCTKDSDIAASMSIDVTSNNIALASVSFSKDSYGYTGKAVKPGVTVKFDGTKLTKGTDYKVSYEDNTEIGTATAIIKGIGDYGGELYADYEIVKGSNPITIAKSSAVASSSTKTFSLGAEAEEDADLIYSSDNSKIKVSSAGKITVKAGYVGKATISITASATDHYKKTTKKFTVSSTPGKVTIDSVASKSTGKITVSWSKASYAGGYQVQFSTKSDFSSGVITCEVPKASTLKGTKSGLKSDKKYYVRVRAYKVVNDEYIKGAWSSKKSVTVK